MKPSFHHRLVNGHFGDPCLYARILRERRAVLFDIGDISALSTAEMLKITDVFVTHTHIDHFIGFDTLLRSLLRRESPLNVYGPPNITSCVQGKLRGYTWNLIRDYPAVINVSAFDGKTIVRSTFRARSRFVKEPGGKEISDGLLLDEPMFSIRAVKLDHDTPCLAYSMEETFHINIDKDHLGRIGLPVGPWLSDFKKILREDPESRKTVMAAGKRYTVRQLSGIANVIKGQKIAYATDLAPTRENIRKLVSVAREADMLYCEAFFLETDRALAVKRSHLTAKTCGDIARLAAARRLVPMHFSQRYADRPGALIDEAMRAFAGSEP